MIETTEAFGRDAATQHKHFVCAYSIVKDDRGTSINGSSPDGKLTGTCDRCGTAIMNIYVFGTADRRSYMHVGCDCARAMGVPLAEIKRARGYWAEQRRECDRTARAASAAERRAAEQAAKDARLAENAAIVEEFREMAANPHATEWERDQCGRLEARIGASGAEWIEAPADEYERRASASIDTIRTRLALCETSVAQPASKKFVRTLTAYRSPIVLEPYTYGSGCSYINFLTDEEGQAYVYKGSSCASLGDVIRATWSVAGEVDQRDGLTATKISRPRKIEQWGDVATQPDAEAAAS